jgi:hypothetical protein
MWLARWAKTLIPSWSTSTIVFFRKHADERADVHPGMAIVLPHPTVLSLGMAVAFYASGISPGKSTPEFPPLPGTLTKEATA